MALDIKRICRNALCSRPGLSKPGSHADAMEVAKRPHDDVAKTPCDALASPASRWTKPRVHIDEASCHFPATSSPVSIPRTCPPSNASFTPFFHSQPSVPLPGIASSGSSRCMTWEPSVTPRGERKDIVDALPEALVFQIFQRVPPEIIARKCALISTTWARIARSDELWKTFCERWGFTAEDASQVLGGWRGLYSRAFGANLVQCPDFEQIHDSEHLDTAVTADGYVECGPFSASWKLAMDGILMDDVPTDQQYRRSSPWEADVDTNLVGSLGRVESSSLFRVRVRGPQCGAALDGRPGGLDVDDVELEEADVEPITCTPTTESLLRNTSLGFPHDLDPFYSGLLHPLSAAQSARGVPAGQPRDVRQLACQLPRCSSLSGLGQVRPSLGPALVRSTSVASISPAGKGVQSTSGAHTAMNTHVELLRLEDPSGPWAQPPMPGSTAVWTSDAAWGRLKQCLSLQKFPAAFLDKCPPIYLSAWCSSALQDVEMSPATLAHHGACAEEHAPRFCMQLTMESEDHQVLLDWKSSEIECNSNAWHQGAVLITGYPKGVRHLVLRVSGCSVHFTRVAARFIFTS